MQRTIHCKVNGESIALSSQNGGVVGDANATGLSLRFAENWRGLQKQIVWHDANGQNAVALLLYSRPQDVEALDPLLFLTPVPAEALGAPGFCFFQLEGYAPGSWAGDVYTPGELVYSIKSRLWVQPAEAPPYPADVTPSVAQQLREYVDDCIEAARGDLEEATAAVTAAGDELSYWDSYDPARTYVPLEKTADAGSSYLCKAVCTGVRPSFDVGSGVEGEYWLLIAKEGDKGDQGPTGGQGLPGLRGAPGPIGGTGVPGGFGDITATVECVPVGGEATVEVTQGGPMYARELSFAFTVPCDISAVVGEIDAINGEVI